MGNNYNYTAFQQKDSIDVKIMQALNDTRKAIESINKLSILERNKFFEIILFEMAISKVSK